MEICEIIKSNTTNIFHDPIKARRNDMKKISISAYETKEPGSVTNWGTGSIGDLIPMEEQGITENNGSLIRACSSIIKNSQ